MFSLIRQPKGMSGLGFLLIFILILFILFVLDMAYIVSMQCDDDFFDCALDVITGGLSSAADEIPPAPAGSVTATGVISGEYGGEDRSVTVVMTFPLEGGAVTGSFSGDCDGSIKGTYAGGDGGAISGTGSGSCALVFPASGSFSGSVNQGGKTVPINGKGSASGFSGEGSLTLTY